MWKITRLRFEKLELQAKLYEERLKILECEHTPTAATSTCYDLFGSQFVDGWELVCSKCGKWFKGMSEIEYLEVSLEADRDSFLGHSNEMEERLTKLRSQKETDD